MLTSHQLGSLLNLNESEVKQLSPLMKQYRAAFLQWQQTKILPNGEPYNPNFTLEKTSAKAEEDNRETHPIQLQTKSEEICL